VRLDVERQFVLGPAPSRHVEEVLAQARRARDERRRLDVTYCGSSAEPSRRTIQPHQVVQARGSWYVYGWCETAAAWRRFRAERFLELRTLDGRFDRRADFRPIERAEDLLQADEVVTARVVFDASIARWLEERYPDGRRTADGGLEVTFPVADPAWFVREMLYYGDRALVIEPASLRQAVMSMVVA
jgi:proteasome accessory factor C